jgi:hypothetical protein
VALSGVQEIIPNKISIPSSIVPGKNNKSKNIFKLWEFLEAQAVCIGC